MGVQRPAASPGGLAPWSAIARRRSRRGGGAGPRTGSRVPGALCCAHPASLSQISHLLARTLQPAAGSGPHGGPRRRPACLLCAQGRGRPLTPLSPCLPSSLCPSSALSLAQCGLHCRGPPRLPSPFSVSHSAGLVPEAALVFRPSHPPPRVCAHGGGGGTGQLRVTAAWAWGSEPLGSGASETQHLCHPQPPSLLPTPLCQAERSAAPRRLGVFVREAISEGVLWLGRPRERDGHKCREGEYALVSSRFTKTAHPACPPPPACALVALGHTDSRAQIETPPHTPQAFYTMAKSHACPEVGKLAGWAPSACPWVCHPPPPPQDVTQVGPDCEGGGLHGRQESGFGPAT